MCNAKATVARIEVEGDIRYVLNDFSDDHKHPGGMAHVIAEDMKFEMCKKVEVNPEKPVSEARNAIIIEYAKKHEDNPDLWAEVIANIGDYDAVDKRQLRARQKVIGNAPKNRNEFDPTKIIEDGEDIIVLDSNLLPSGWKDKHEITRDQSRNNDLVRTFEETWIEDPENENTSDPEEVEKETEGEALPKRILVFTSAKLLKLFEKNDGKSSVDGTFKAIPILWKQLFIWMIKFEGFWIPVAWAWLPDKTLQSYNL